MRKRHFKDKINATRQKHLKTLRLLLGRQIEDHQTQSSSWFVTWRQLHNVQTKKVSHHAEMSVKYCFKTSSWNASMHNEKEWK